MNYRALEEFLVFAEEQSYSSAAKKLMTTRTTLRYHLTQLEKVVGVPLVSVLPGNAVGLTHYGQQFVEDATQILATIDAVTEKYRIMREDTLSIRIGSVDLVWLEPALFLARDEFLRRNPGKGVDIIAVSRDDIASAFAYDQVDLAVVSLKKWCGEDITFEHMGVPGDLAFKVGEEETLLLVPHTSVLFKKDHIVASDLDGQTVVLPADIAAWWTRDGVIEALARKGGQVQLVGEQFRDLASYFAYHFEHRLGGVSASQVLRSGLGVRQDCRAMSIVDMPLISDFYLVHSPKFAENAMANRFLECLELYAPENYKPK